MISTVPPPPGGSGQEQPHKQSHAHVRSESPAGTGTQSTCPWHRPQEPQPSHALATLTAHPRLSHGTSLGSGGRRGACSIVTAAWRCRQLMHPLGPWCLDGALAAPHSQRHAHVAESSGPSNRSTPPHTSRAVPAGRLQGPPPRYLASTQTHSRLS